MEIFLVLLLLILLNGVFAMAELAVVSSRKVRLQQWAEEGKRGARTALTLAEEPTRFLSTVQIGITSISILSGVFGEASIARSMEAWLLHFPSIAAYAKPVSVGVMVVLITALSLIIGELVPKRLAMHSPEMIAVIISRPMQLLSKLAAPLVKILSVVTDALLKLLGAGRSNGPSITEEEIRVLMEQGADEGIFDRAEQELVENIFRLDERKLGAIMTPRKDIVFLDLEAPLEHNQERLLNSIYSRFPVCKKGLEQIVGIVSAKDMLNHLLQDQSFDLSASLKPPLYVPSTLTPKQLMTQFRKTRTHIALIVDEYGELEGLVTINDVLEAIVGDLPPQELREEEEIVRRDDGSWLVDGMLGLDRFKDHFDIDGWMPGEDSGNVNTLGGFIMYQLGRVPVVADHLVWRDWRLEVMDMDKTRVDKILVKAVTEEEQEFFDIE